MSETHQYSFPCPSCLTKQTLNAPKSLNISPENCRVLCLFPQFFSLLFTRAFTCKLEIDDEEINTSNGPVVLSFTNPPAEFTDKNVVEGNFVFLFIAPFPETGPSRHVYIISNSPSLAKATVESISKFIYTTARPTHFYCVRGLTDETTKALCDIQTQIMTKARVGPKTRIRTENTDKVEKPQDDLLVVFGDEVDEHASAARQLEEEKLEREKIIQKWEQYSAFVKSCAYELQLFHATVAVCILWNEGCVRTASKLTRAASQIFTFCQEQFKDQEWVANFMKTHPPKGPSYSKAVPSPEATPDAPEQPVSPVAEKPTRSARNNASHNNLLRNDEAEWMARVLMAINWDAAVVVAGGESAAMSSAAAPTSSATSALSEATPASCEAQPPSAAPSGAEDPLHPESLPGCGAALPFEASPMPVSSLPPIQQEVSRDTPSLDVSSFSEASSSSAPFSSLSIQSSSEEPSSSAVPSPSTLSLSHPSSQTSVCTDYQIRAFIHQVSSFSTRVIFASPIFDALFRFFQRTMALLLVHFDLFGDQPARLRHWEPHITLFKLPFHSGSRFRELHKWIWQSEEKEDTEESSAHSPKEKKGFIGEMNITSIELCQMHGKKKGEFYVVTETGQLLGTARASATADHTT